MVQDQLVEYISSQMKLGIARDAIKSALVGVGWAPLDVEDTLKKVEGGAAPVRYSPSRRRPFRSRAGNRRGSGKKSGATNRSRERSCFRGHAFFEHASRNFTQDNLFRCRAAGRKGSRHERFAESDPCGNSPTFTSSPVQKKRGIESLEYSRSF